MPRQDDACFEAPEGIEPSIAIISAIALVVQQIIEAEVLRDARGAGAQHDACDCECRVRNESNFFTYLAHTRTPNHYPPPPPPHSSSATAKTPSTANGASAATSLRRLARSIRPREDGNLW